MLCVFLREHRFISRNTPVNSKSIIYYRNTTISFRMIKIITFVLEYGHITQYGKAMSKTTGHKELTMVIFRQFYCYMFAVCKTALTDIHSHIKYSTLYATNEFTLSKWWSLERNDKGQVRVI